MGRGYVARDEDDEEGRSLPPSYESSAQFVGAIRRGDQRAMRDLFRFYSPLLRSEARHASVPAGESKELVTTVLNNVAMHFVDGNETPHNLARYLIAAVRNAARSRRRDRGRAEATEMRAYSEFLASGERIVAECHSEYGLDIAHSPDEKSDERLRSAIAKLASYSASILTETEIRLLMGHAHHVPMRDLAEQNGLSHTAARQRVFRVRERLPALVRQHVASLDPSDRLEIERFMRRAGFDLPYGQRRSGDAMTRTRSTPDSGSNEGRNA